MPTVINGTGLTLMPDNDAAMTHFTAGVNADAGLTFPPIIRHLHTSAEIF